MAKHILLADNNQKFLRNRKELLEEQGYLVFPAADVTEARRILEQGLVDLAILDIRLENDHDERDLSGLILAKETDRGIPKIILTRFPNYQDVREALGDFLDGLPAAVDFVAKQEGMEPLLRAMRKALQLASRSFRTTQDEIAEQLNEDYRRARKEAAVHYWVNLAASLIFAIPVIIGTLLVLRGTLDKGAAMMVAGVVLQVVHYLFAARLNVAHRRVDRYHEELLQTKRLENLLAGCKEINDEAASARCINYIIQTTAQAWIGGQKMPPGLPARASTKQKLKEIASKQDKHE